MSGYCSDCGNTLCLCDDLKQDGVSMAFAELARLKDEMKEATLLIECMRFYINAYHGEFNPDAGTTKDMIIATRWLERNKK